MKSHAVCSWLDSQLQPFNHVGAGLPRMLLNKLHACSHTWSLLEPKPSSLAPAMVTGDNSNTTKVEFPTVLSTQ